jgi:hypothetical protein
MTSRLYAPELESIGMLQSQVLYHTYIPLTLYPRRDSRGILDIPPRRPHFTQNI